MLLFIQQQNLMACQFWLVNNSHSEGLFNSTNTFRENTIQCKKLNIWKTLCECVGRRKIVEHTLAQEKIYSNRFSFTRKEKDGVDKCKLFGQQMPYNIFLTRPRNTAHSFKQGSGVIYFFIRNVKIVIRTILLSARSQTLKKMLDLKVNCPRKRLFCLSWKC